jgi:hypothetical protein
MASFNISFEDEQSWYEENYEVEDAGEIETKDLEECQYKNMRRTFDSFEKLKEENEKLKEELEKAKDNFLTLSNAVDDKFASGKWVEGIN